VPCVCQLRRRAHADLASSQVRASKLEPRLSRVRQARARISRQPASPRQTPSNSPSVARAADQGEWLQRWRTRLGYDFRQRSRLSSAVDLQVICCPLLVTPRAPSVEQNAPERTTGIEPLDDPLDGDVLVPVLELAEVGAEGVVLVVVDVLVVAVVLVELDDEELPQRTSAITASASALRAASLRARVRAPVISTSSSHGPRPARWRAPGRSYACVLSLPLLTR
jgi:hypothetical protein